MTDLESKLDLYLRSAARGIRTVRGRTVPRIGYLHETQYGEIWVVDWHYPAGYLHGRFELEKLQQSHELLTNKEPFDPSSATVIDIETTGLAGGTGTYAFIMGCGFWRDDTFIVRQFVMRDFNEEPAQLAAFARTFTGGIITFNGKCFDVPLLVNRFRIHRFEPPFDGAFHLDMLFPSRRIWKRHLSSFKLTELEARVLGYARDDDIPSYLIPSIFFDFLQNRDESLLYPVLHHNRDDILSLYHLTNVVSELIRKCVNHGHNDDDLLLSLAELSFSVGGYEQAVRLTEKINTSFASEDTHRRAMRLQAMAFKKLGQWAAAAKTFAGISSIRPEVDSLTELAKLYEHKLKEPRRALELVRQMESLVELESYIRGEPSPEFPDVMHRKQRLLAKVARRG